MSFYRRTPNAAQRRGHYLIGARRDQAETPAKPIPEAVRLGALRELTDGDLRRAGEVFMGRGDVIGVAAVQREYIRRRRDGADARPCPDCGAVTFGLSDACGRCGSRERMPAPNTIKREER